MIDLRRSIEEAYIRCESELAEPRPKQIDVTVVRNHIIIFVKGIPAAEEPVSSGAAGGKSVRKALSGLERKQFYSMLAYQLTEITGCRVTSIQTDIYIDTCENMEMFHFDCDLESKFAGD